MSELLTTALAVLTSGAGGGIVGGILAILKRGQDRKERIELERIALEREKADYLNAKEEREHALTMLQAGAQIELEKVQTEAEAEMEVSHQNALSNAQKVLGKLKTSTWMDNYRASVRPTLAYFVTFVFSVAGAWAFTEFASQLTPQDGGKILLGMFATLTFAFTSIITFYYVARKDQGVK